MSIILEFQEKLQDDLVKVCNDYCKYSKECVEYFENHPEEEYDYKFDGCPILGLFGDM